MRYVITMALLVSTLACKQAGPGDEATTGIKLGAADAAGRRDTNFQRRSCYCSFLLDDGEREPFSQRGSATAKKSELCLFVPGDEGRDQHQLESLTVESFSGAQLTEFETQLARLTFSQHLPRYNQSLKKGSGGDLRIELRIGKTADGRYEKRTLAYDDYVGRMFFVTERAAEVGDKNDLSQVFDDTGIRYIDALFLNYQAACESSLEL